MDTSNITNSINEQVERLKAYILSLNEKEKLAWLLIVAGVIFLILGAILW